MFSQGSRSLWEPVPSRLVSQREHTSIATITSTDIRRLLNSDLATLRHGQQQIRQGQYSQAALLSETKDLLQHLLGRVSKLERAARFVEQPQAPQPARMRRLFD